MMSVIIPAFNEDMCIERTASEVAWVLRDASIEYELIFVDDGSTDNSWNVLTNLTHCAPNIRAIRLSRNFGKDSAILAGLSRAKGECAAVLDCDLQFPPSVLVEMYRVWSEGGVDIVHGKKNARGKEKLSYKMSAAVFYRTLKMVSNVDLEDASDFKLLSRQAVEAVLDMPESYSFFRAMASWVGFRSETVYFDVQERETGSSRWSMPSLFRLAINSITSYSALPMQFVTVCGVAFFVFAIILAFQTLYKKVSGGAVEGFTTVILLLLIFGSITMISLGIIGFYLSKIYTEVKRRPRYLVMDEK